MKYAIKRGAVVAFSIITGIFTFVPEGFFGIRKWISDETLKLFNMSDVEAEWINITISRIICLILVWFIVSICIWIYRCFRKKKIIKGKNYSISIEYGDLLNEKGCKKVINFDECYTTTVGGAIGDVNPKSLCGQYLALPENSELDVQHLIEEAEIKPAKGKSKYKQKVRYASGTIVPNGDDLLMAFAKLDDKGKGRFFSRDEYIECLTLLWKEIENYYAENDVCIPILGSGTTSFDSESGASISQQDLLNIIIQSYKLSSHKIKAPHKLRIICRKHDDFSINKIDA